MIKVTVDRKTWYRGEGHETSFLLAGEKRCCVGFLGAALGISDGSMRGKPSLASVTDCIIAQDFHSKWALGPAPLIDAYHENDRVDISDTKREERLTKIGRKMGVEFTFIN